jgi:hypothetical protein
VCGVASGRGPHFHFSLVLVLLVATCHLSLARSCSMFHMFIMFMDDGCADHTALSERACSYSSHSADVHVHHIAQLLPVVPPSGLSKQ